MPPSSSAGEAITKLLLPRAVTPPLPSRSFATSPSKIVPICTPVLPLIRRTEPTFNVAPWSSAVEATTKLLLPSAVMLPKPKLSNASSPARVAPICTPVLPSTSRTDPASVNPPSSSFCDATTKLLLPSTVTPLLPSISFAIFPISATPICAPVAPSTNLIEPPSTAASSSPDEAMTKLLLGRAVMP